MLFHTTNTEALEHIEDGVLGGVSLEHGPLPHEVIRHHMRSPFTPKHIPRRRRSSIAYEFISRGERAERQTNRGLRALRLLVLRAESPADKIEVPEVGPLIQPDNRDPGNSKTLKHIFYERRMDTSQQIGEATMQQPAEEPLDQSELA